jgi:hypothetical protein
MKEHIDTCFAGNGVVCGVEVHVNADCSIEVAAGTVILPDGTILHTPQKKFRYYVKPAGGQGQQEEEVNQRVQQFMLAYLQLDKLDPRHMEFLLLAGEGASPDKVDSLKQQHPDDIPERNLNRDKIILLLALPGKDEEAGPDLYWILVTRNAMARTAGIEAPKEDDDQALFSKAFSPDDIDIAAVDRHLRPVLQLPLLTIPRFGYRGLAIIQPPVGLQEDNLQPPFTDVDSYEQIFFEYKTIIDDYLQVLRDALKLLHTLFGPLLSHKVEKLEDYRRILSLKIAAFYEEGLHLYYIQYVYDWLRDLTTAHNELVVKLNGYRGGCTCKELTENDAKGLVVLLGPVLGGRTTYQPLIFRDLAITAERDAAIREVRCLHWRLMVMIRTFDLPFLRLDKALTSTNQTIEDKLDSTDYWESLVNPDDNDEFRNLPIKFTPTRSTAAPLGKTAIPYYYPLDSNSIYSVHQFWDDEATVLRRMDTLLSYNAHEGDEDKSSTDVINDSYSTRTEVLMPLAFNFEPNHWLRVEGHIGKTIVFTGDSKDFYLEGFDLEQYLLKYNLCVDVIAVNIHSATNKERLPYLTGLEHRPALQQGHTLVLIYTDTDEQIELHECSRTDRAEIKANTIIGDFVLPYRFTCCALWNLDYYVLNQQPSERV